MKRSIYRRIGIDFDYGLKRNNSYAHTVTSQFDILNLESSEGHHLRSNEFTGKSIIGDEVDIKDIRRVNLVATIFFALFGGIGIASNFYNYYRFKEEFPEYEYSIEYNILIIWLILIIVFTILLYMGTVFSLDRGKYRITKFCMLIGIFVGWIGLIIPSLAFIKSYRSFDDAFRLNKENVNRNSIQS
jgi:hypothetical protein